MAQYVPILEFYSDKLPLVSKVYGSSESIFGMNVDPLCKPQDVSYTFVSNISYFEYLIGDILQTFRTVSLLSLRLLMKPKVSIFETRSLLRRRRAPFPLFLFSAPPLSPLVSLGLAIGPGLSRSDSLVRVVALSGDLSGTGAVGREALWVSVDSFSRLLRSLEVASVFLDLGFGLRVTASGAPSRFSRGVVVWWAKKALSFGDPAACSKWWARVGKQGVVNRVSSLFLARALEIVDDVCASLGSSSFLFAWLVGWRQKSSIILSERRHRRFRTFLVLPGRYFLGAVCFKVWVAFLSGSTRQPVPAPFTPVPLVRHYFGAVLCLVSVSTSFLLIIICWLSSNSMLVDFTCSADISTFPSHYVFYLELKAKDINDVLELDENVKVLVECCSVIEESFGALYRGMRRSGSIGPLEIRVVQQGTFDALMDYFISRGGSMAQYKTPICIKFSEVLVVLENNVLVRF
ncbi:hypothetical protein Bca4012_098263 [Brassica carinata]